MIPSMTAPGREATLDEARSLVRDTPFAQNAADVLGMMADIWPTRIVDESLRVPSLEVGSIIVVRGDLVVHGLLADVPSDHGAMLVVLGDLEAVDLIFHGPIFVTGNVTLKGTAFFASSSDWALTVAGSLRGGLLVEYDHGIEVLGEVSWEHAYRRGQDPRPLIADEFLYPDQQRRRVDGVLVEVTVHYIDPAPMEDAIRAGRSVLRSRGLTTT